MSIEIANENFVEAHIAKVTATCESFKLELLSAGDLERVLHDLKELGGVSQRCLSNHLRQVWTWARSTVGNAYLIHFPTGEVEGSGRYQLFCAGEMFEVETTTITSDMLRFVDFPKSSKLSREEVKSMFLAALTVYGKGGKGQDGHFNTEPDSEDVIFHQCIPAFEEDR